MTDAENAVALSFAEALCEVCHQPTFDAPICDACRRSATGEEWWEPRDVEVPNDDD